ncbi:hypothetical protein [Leucobacter insecticola]|uniref:hypothetical protein n=1 Tax=Leucobacter insecticola TaxID=2714934 RepID=UPI001FCC8D94|nr:hypothetical protein [Leucobacter insecticola]
MFVISAVALATSGGWILVNGIINFVGERTILWGLSPLVGIIAGSLLIALWIAILVVIGLRRARQNRN